MFCFIEIDRNDVMKFWMLATVAILTAVLWQSSAQAQEAPPAVKLTDASWEKTQELIASHKGKVVVLDVWSTYCEECVKEFPHLVALQAKHGAEVLCISLNSNNIGGKSLEEDRPEVLKFLQAKQAQLLNLMSTDADEALYKKIGIASIPVVQVYDRQGKLVKQFDNEKSLYGKEGFRYDKHIYPFVAELLKQPAK
jgi:thiol-disulfide isomerase/thioredoxin